MKNLLSHAANQYSKSKYTLDQGLAILAYRNKMIDLHSKGGAYNEAVAIKVDQSIKDKFSFYNG